MTVIQHPAVKNNVWFIFAVLFAGQLTVAVLHVNSFDSQNLRRKNIYLRSVDVEYAADWWCERDRIFSSNIQHFTTVSHRVQWAYSLSRCVVLQFIQLFRDAIRTIMNYINTIAAVIHRVLTCSHTDRLFYRRSGPMNGCHGIRVFTMA